MDVTACEDPSPADVAAPRAVAARASQVGSQPRLIRIGLLGLGTVGQGVARLANRVDAAQLRGLELRIEGALVRDVGKSRRCQPPARLTSNPSAFLRGQYDVVIEALGGLEPARTIVARLLGRGVPVVTANKTLIAVAGQELHALAAARGTSLRYEASALAGVPFLGTLAARPLVSAIDRFAAVLNGTSNFIVSTLETGGTVADARELARRRGLTEPDPSRDLDGLDAADKLALLCGWCGWGRFSPEAIDTTSIRHVTAADARAARSIGTALKPIAVARRTTSGIDAFVGPACVPAQSPLATLSGTLNGIELHGRYVRDLFFSGPGAGPDVTAATLLDDVVETVSTDRTRESATAVDALDYWRHRLRPSGACIPTRASAISTPATPWLLRVAFPGIVPTASLLAGICAHHGLAVEHVTDAIDDARYVLVGPAHQRAVDTAIDTLQRQHRTACAAFRRLTGSD